MKQTRSNRPPVCAESTLKICSARVHLNIFSVMTAMHAPGPDLSRWRSCLLDCKRNYQLVPIPRQRINRTNVCDQSQKINICDRSRLNYTYFSSCLKTYDTYILCEDV